MHQFFVLNNYDINLILISYYFIYILSLLDNRMIIIMSILKVNLKHANIQFDTCS